MSELLSLLQHQNISQKNWVPINMGKMFHGLIIYYRPTGERKGEYILVDSEGATVSGPFETDGTFNSMLAFAVRAEDMSSIEKESMALVNTNSEES